MPKKTILLDLGAEVIKALEIENNGTSFNIVRAVSSAGATAYLDDKGLKSMEGLVNYVDELLKENAFTSKTIMISTSAFNINTNVEITENDVKSINGFQADNLTLSTYQIYGETQTEKSSERHYAVSNAARLPIESLARTFEQYGYTVTSIEDAKTAEMNLIKLKPWNYDIPDKVILSLGRRPYIYGFTQDALSFIETLDSLFIHMLEKISESLECGYSQFRDIFAMVGVERSEYGANVLNTANIDAESYYESIGKFCYEAFKDLKEKLDTITEDHRVNHYYLIVTGGFADVPGMYRLIEQIFNDEATTIIRGAISRRFSDKYKTIENKLVGRTSDIGCIYGNCIGLLFKERFGIKANLLPTAKKTIQKGSLIIALSKVAIAVILIASASTAFRTVSNILQYVSFPEITNAAEINGEYQKLISKERVLNDRLQAIKSIDKTAVKLIEFTGKYKDPMLSIVSIDTQDMLESEGISDTVKEEKKSISPFADISEETEEAEETVEETKAIIIRGYALSSSAVSQFSSAIYDAGISDKVYVDGVEKVELPSGESLYIFQIYLEQPTQQAIDSSISLRKEGTE